MGGYYTSHCTTNANGRPCYNFYNGSATDSRYEFGHGQQQCTSAMHSLHTEWHMHRWRKQGGTRGTCPPFQSHANAYDRLSGIWCTVMPSAPSSEYLPPPMTCSDDCRNHLTAISDHYDTARVFNSSYIAISTPIL